MDTTLDLKSKVMLAALPFLIAGAIIFCLLIPQINDFNDKNNLLENRKKDERELETKLADSKKVQKQKAELEAAINALRSSVPRSPDTEVLYIDLEKLCMDSGLELLSIGPPGAAAKKEEENQAKQAANKLKAAIKGGGGGGGSSKPKAEPTGEGGLMRNTLELKLFGSYKNLMTLVDKLEHYQRVLAVTEVHMSVPPLSKTGKADYFNEGDIAAGEPPGNPDYSHMNLVLTTYYLP